MWTEVDAGKSMDPTKRRQTGYNISYITCVVCSVECSVCSVKRGPTNRRQRQSELRHCQSEASNVCLLTVRWHYPHYASVCLLTPAIILITLEECPLASVITRETTLWKWLCLPWFFFKLKLFEEDWMQWILSILISQHKAAVFM